jgi:hypothetical protein
MPALFSDSSEVKHEIRKLDHKPAELLQGASIVSAGLGAYQVNSIGATSAAIWSRAT